MSQDRTNVLVALLAGLAAGAVLGVLFAPASGKETRDKLRAKGAEAKENLEDLVAEGRRKWGEAKGKASDAASMTADDVQDFMSFLMSEGRDLLDRMQHDTKPKS